MITSPKKDLVENQPFWEHISGRDTSENKTLDDTYLEEATKHIENAIKKNKQHADRIPQEIEEEGIPKGPKIIVEEW